MPKQISDEELLSHLRELADRLGKVPTVTEMNEKGEYSAGTYNARFGSWCEAVEKVGLESRGRTADSVLLDALRELADELDRTPTANEMCLWGEYHKSTYKDHFGTWNEAVEAAGLKPHNRKVPESELLAEFERVVDELGRVPYQREMNAHGEYSSGAYHNRFGSWNEAIREAGFEPRKREIPREDLLEALRELADELGRSPNLTDMNDYGEYSAGPYQRRFESWNHALYAAGLIDVPDEMTEAAVVEDIERVADAVGAVPTEDDVREHGRFPVASIRLMFGTVDAAIREAGFEPQETQAD